MPSVRNRVALAASAAVLIPLLFAPLAASAAPEGPVAGADSALTGYGRAVTLDVLANDTGIRLTIASVSTANGGTTVLNGDGTITFTPDAGFFGTARFTYTVLDAFGESTVGSVAVEVGPPPAPVAVDDTVSGPWNQALTVDVLANDTGTGLILVGATGTDVDAAVSGDRVVVTPRAGSVPKSTTVAYTVKDVVGRTATADIAVGFTGPALAPAADRVTGAWPAPVTVDVLANDAGAGLRVVSAGPAAGQSAPTVVVGPDGRHVTITPSRTVPFGDVARYEVVDVFGDRAGADIAIDWNAPAAPVASPDSASTAYGTPVTVDVLANDSGASLSVESVGAVAGGTATLGADSTVTFTPAAGFVGQAGFDYTVTDAAGRTASSTVTVEVALPAQPVLVAAAVTTGYRTLVSVDALAGATGEGVTLSSVGEVEHGSVVLTGEGAVSFTPDRGFAGTTTFTVVAADRFGQEATGTVEVTVTPPAAPIAVGDTASTAYGTAVVADVLANDSGTGLIVTAADAGDAGSVEVGGDGTLAFQPADGFSGVATVAYTVADEVGQTADGTLAVTVAAAPQPVVVPPTGISAPAPAPAPAAAAGGLPATGVDVVLPLVAGLALLALGFGLAFLGRRRSSGETA